MEFANCRTDLPVILLYDLDLSWPAEDIRDRREASQQLAEALVEVGHPVRSVQVETPELEPFLAGFDPDEFMVLNWCEEFPGVIHSEYQVAQDLERLGYTFTGSDSRTLAFGQDKRKVKRRMQKAGLPIPDWRAFPSTSDVDWDLFPAIVKPALEHCSYGISRESVVQSRSEMIRRMEYILDEFKQPAVVEEFIDGREFHVGAIGNGYVRMLPPAEIDYSAFSDIHDRLCTYEANFDKNSLAYKLTAPKLPVDLTEEQLEMMEKIVIAGYREIDCRDYARMDIRFKDGKFYLLDVNPNPDISIDTSLSLGAGLIGLSYGRLGSLFINLAAKRHPTMKHKILEMAKN